MRHFHTVVIGAGPGGLTCAEVLGRHGIDVLILEKNRLIGPKICAGGITSAGLTRYIDSDLIEKSFNSQYIASKWQNVRIAELTPIVATVNREKIGQWMLEKAIATGVTVKTGALVRDIWDSHVSTDRDRFSFKYLVGADGSSSVVRRYLGLTTARVGTGIHYQVQGNFNRMEWHLDTKLFGNGYAWIFPHRDSASVGVYGGRGGVKPIILLTRLHQWAQRKGINLNGLRRSAALINYDYQGWRFRNIFLVGDAAGLASGLTGEGIFPAILSGETAAKAIIDSNYNTNRLDRLVRKHKQHSRLLDFSARNKLLGGLIIEMLIMGLRLGLIHFNILEMGE